MSNNNMTICVAAESGDKNAIASFIEKGENVNTADAYNRTPLHYASIGGWTEIVVMLLGAGASVSAVTGRGTTPLHYAARSGKAECLPFLIDQGAEVNCQDSTLTTPLLTAITYKQFPTAVVLLNKYNADPNISSKDNISPLSLAIKESAPIELILSLIEHGAKYKDKDIWNKLRLIKPVFKLNTIDNIEMNNDISKLYPITNESQSEGSENGLSPRDLVQSNKFYSDIIFMVEGQKIQCHKCIVASRCPSFISIFYVDGKVGGCDVINIKSISYNVFPSIIEWIYRNKITGLINSKNNISYVTSLLLAAEQYGIKPIITQCENILLEKVTSSNVASVWEDLKKSSFIKLNCPNLMKHCCYLIMKSWNILSSLKQFSELSTIELVDIFKWISLDSSPEAEPEKPKQVEKKQSGSNGTSKASAQTPNKSTSSSSTTPNKSSTSSTALPSMDEKNKEKCKSIVNSIFKKKNSLAFHYPVDPIAEGIPDYPNVIKNPMDLTTIKSKIENNSYKTIKDFASDILLMYQNAFTFNDDNSYIFKVAKNLQLSFIKQFETTYPNEAPQIIKQLTPPPPSQPTTPAITATTSTTPIKTQNTSVTNSTTSTPVDKKRKSSEPSNISIKSETPTKPQPPPSTPISEKKPDQPTQSTPKESVPPKEPTPKESTAQVQKEIVKSEVQPMEVEKTSSNTNNNNIPTNNNGSVSTATINNNNNNNSISSVVTKHYTDDEKKAIMESIYSLELEQIKHIFTIVDDSAVKQIEENLELDITELSDANLIEIEEYLHSCQKKLKLDTSAN